jgi:hypothetical protein
VERMQLPRADCVMKIDIRTAIAILVCGFVAAIAPIDTGWSQMCSVREASSTGQGGLLLNGQPATPAQIKQCEQCASGASRSSACAKYIAAAEARSDAQSVDKNCNGGAGSSASACKKARADELKDKAAELKAHEAASKNQQNQNTGNKFGGNTTNTGNTIQAKPMTAPGTNSKAKSNK